MEQRLRQVGRRWLGVESQVVVEKWVDEKATVCFLSLSGRTGQGGHSGRGEDGIG